RRRTRERRAPHPRLPLQARNHHRRRRGQPLRSRSPRALPHQGSRRPQPAPRPPLPLANLRARASLPRPRRPPRPRIHHARDDRQRLQNRRPLASPPREQLRDPRSLPHRPHGDAPRPPHHPRPQSPRHQTRPRRLPHPRPPPAPRRHRPPKPPHRIRRRIGTLFHFAPTIPKIP